MAGKTESIGGNPKHRRMHLSAGFRFREHGSPIKRWADLSRPVIPFRDWAAEATDHPREVVEAAYRRTDLLERQRLMDDWAAYLAGECRDPEAGPIR